MLSSPQLEKFKFVLDFKIKELKRQIEPRETEIGSMKEQIKEMDRELEQVKLSEGFRHVCCLLCEGQLQFVRNEGDNLLGGYIWRGHFRHTV